MEDYIFNPLGMSETGFEICVGQRSRMATLYRSEKDGSLTEIHGDRAAVPLKQNTVLGAEANHWGGSGLFSTPKDWLKFTDMLRRAFRGEKNLAAPPELVQRMASNQLKQDNASLLLEGPAGFSEWMPFEGLGMGLGVWVTQDPELLGWISNKGEFGWGGVANTVFWVDPVTDSSVMFFTQVKPSSRLGLRFDLYRLAVRAISRSV